MNLITIKFIIMSLNLSNMTKYLAQRSNYYKKLLWIPIPKKKSEVYYCVQEGHVKYKIYFDGKIQCQCGVEVCTHICYLLIEIFQLSELSTKFILIYPEISEYFRNIINLTANNNEFNHLIENHIKEVFNQDSCGICLDLLGDPRYQYQFEHCQTCRKYTHEVCFKRWKNKTLSNNPLNFINCVYCRGISP